jgi:ketopantoate reductase
LLDVIANATVAILDMPAREVFRSARLLNVEVAALLEALAILRLQGVEIVNLPRAPARTLTRLVERLPRTFLPPILRQLGYGQRGSQTMSSLHTDIALGRKRTEVAWLNGAIVQATEGMRRVAPINHALALIVSDIASGRVAWEMYRHKPEALLTAVRTTRGPLRYVE